ncbi:MAG: riboflavin biosynthesis protein RibF [Rhodospirillaceae bacterium]|jgi:riboflavin kinase/FMN adenylyltransferase|nr:riboflavin biosynthesis protein RibF [Rhodospirillaceae bacterium]
MRIIRHYVEFPGFLRGSVIALGNFDGVHLGHQKIIKVAKMLSVTKCVACGVMSFEPHPRELFDVRVKAFRLTPFRTKVRLIESLKPDFILMQRFNCKFSEYIAEKFILQVLVASLDIRHVVVGYDYVFGHDRIGNVALLRKMAQYYKYTVTCIDPIADKQNTLYSSTRIREYLISGFPRKAAHLLGHNWEIEGRVEHGNKRGCVIGFPTANIKMSKYLYPATGVYAVMAGIDRNNSIEWFPGVANFGVQPTFSEQVVLFEVHLFDFNEDIYGRYLRVSLIEYLRPEIKFNNIQALKIQIEEDSKLASQILKSNDIQIIDE